MQSWTLIWPEEVRRIMREIIPPRREVMVPLADLLGKTLSRPLEAFHPHPAFRQSSVDGYALGSLQETPYTLVGESRAGVPFQGQIGPGEAIRIFTGAAVPASTISIVMQEKTNVTENQLFLLQTSVKGAYIREKGEQFGPGQPLFPSGHTCTPENIGLLHGLGISSAMVFDTPKVHLMVTGHEVIPFPQPLKDGQIWDENGPALRAYCQTQQVHCHLNYVEDAIGDLVNHLEKGLYSDLLLVTGGVSVGDYDLVPEALSYAGVEKYFHGVRQKPGKPLWMGKKGQTLVFALPGNPAAVMCIWHLYLAAFIQYFKGQDFIFPEEKAKIYPLAHPCNGETGRTSYLRARLHDQEIFPMTQQASYMLGGFIEANGLAILPAGKTQWQAGDHVAFIQF